MPVARVALRGLGLILAAARALTPSRPVLLTRDAAARARPALRGTSHLRAVLKEIVPDEAAYEGTTEAEKAYFSEQETAYDVDEGAWKSEAFWLGVDQAMPGWREDPKLDRFRGFCENLQKKPPGVDLIMENRQQLLSQYVYPGLGEDDASADVHRSAYPHDAYPELARLRERLRRDVAPAARAEFDAVVAAIPLARDEESFDDDAGEWDPLGLNKDDVDETWQKAAWFGWQFLSLRGAAATAPKTTKALLDAMGDLGPAHRFVGFTRQKADSRGTVHSDGRNYMLSTLTPIDAPEGCGIFVDDEEATIATDGDAIVLDNTFPHYIYNNDPAQDRICLMSECWHPALRKEERKALSTLFAVKDRFTVLDLSMCPWGYTEDDLAKALKSGAVHDLDFWQNLDYSPKKKKAPKKLGANKKNKKSAAKKRAFG